MSLPERFLQALWSPVVHVPQPPRGLEEALVRGGQHPGEPPLVLVVQLGVGVLGPHGEGGGGDSEVAATTEVHLAHVLL